MPCSKFQPILRYLLFNIGIEADPPGERARVGHEVRLKLVYRKRGVEASILPTFKPKKTDRKKDYTSEGPVIMKILSINFTEES